jgi:hypothetical protein
MVEAPQSDQPNQNAAALQRQPKEQFSLDVRPPRTWPAVVFGICLFVGAIGGVCAIVWASSLFTEITAIATFITGSIVGLFTLLAIAAQVFVYWEQRNLMARQWNAMLGGIDRTNGVIEKMHAQLEAINKQEAHLLTQARAAITAAEAAKAQAKTVDRQLVLGTRAYVGIHEIKMDIPKQCISLYVANVGSIPASKLQIVCELSVRTPWEYVPDMAPSTLRKALEVTPECWLVQIPFLRSYGDKTKLFPGLNLEIMIPLSVVNPSEEGGYFTDKEMPLIVQGLAQVSIRGEIRYSDGFNSGKTTSFSYRYYRLGPRGESGDFWAAQRINDSFGSQDPERPDEDYKPN